MRKMLSCPVIGLVIGLASFSVTAEHHLNESGTEQGVSNDAQNADLQAAIKAFDRAYATNDVERYFSLYADGATVFVDDGRVDMADYHEMWTGLMAAGGGVELNVMSDLRVQIMPSGDVAIATSFIDNRTRAPDGTTSSSRAFETDVWQKIDGTWQIISLHYSTISVGEP